MPLSHFGRYCYVSSSDLNSPVTGKPTLSQQAARTPRVRAGQHGLGQLTLAEHSLCPLDASASLQARLHGCEYFYTDASRRRCKARVRIDTPEGLSAHDEFFLWGLLALALSQREATFDFYATPHYCLKQLGCLAPQSKGGKNYALFRQALRRLSSVRYQNDQFYDPVRREHRAVSFGFFSYSLPLDPGSSRAWRIIWDPLFFEICQASGGHVVFDLETYRNLDCAARRLFLLLKKVFWRRTVSPVFDVRNLAVSVLGYSASRATSKLKSSVKQCATQLLVSNIVALPDGARSVGELFTKRGNGRQVVQFQRGGYFDQPRRTSQKPSANDSPLCEPLRTIGFDERAVRRIRGQFPPATIGIWADVTLAALERKGTSFFRHSPQAFFMDSIQQAARGRRTPPDWFAELHKQEQGRQAESARQTRKEHRAREADDGTPCDLTMMSPADREVFERVMEEMLAQFRTAGQPLPDAQRNAERFARAHLRRRNVKRQTVNRPLRNDFSIP